MIWSLALQKRVIDYYENYYRTCGLADFKERAKARLREEEAESEKMKYLQQILNLAFNSSQKHFIFGAGTGGLAVVLAKEYGCQVFGVEPSEEEFEIIQEKCREAGLNPNNFKREFGENLSFSDNQFDLVHCFTVLEHVQNVKKCIQEMVRVTKPSGLIYINTPNYRFPIEKHYKIVFPTFLPKFFGKAYLALRGKSIAFIDSINFLTEKKINKILINQENIRWFRVYQPNFLSEKKGAKGFLLKILIKRLFIYPNQEIIIQKL